MTSCWIVRTAWSLLVMATVPLLRAQEVGHGRSIVSGGPNLAMGAGAAGGIHLQLGLEWPLGRSIKVRAEGLAWAIMTASANPSCVRSPCESYSDPYPPLVYAGSLSLVAPLGGLKSRFTGLAGVGAYHGTGLKSTSEMFGSAMGASLGIGLPPWAINDREVSLEVRYHHLFGGLGRLSGVLVPSFTLAFF